MNRGDIYLVDFSDNVGSEQAGLRPAVIVQNECHNKSSPTTIVCPMTSRQKKETGTHVTLSPEDCGVRTTSIVLCEQIRVIDKSRMVRKVGTVTQQKILDINKKLMVSIGLSIGD